MYIAHVINHLHTGGAEKLVAEIANATSMKGMRVKVISLFKGRGVPFEILDKKNVELIELNYEKKFNPKIALDLYLLTRNCDIIHSHTYYAQLYSSMLISSKKLITTEHSTSNNRRGKKVFRILDNLMYSRYEKVICISKGTQENLVDWIPNVRRKSVVINNGINLEKFSEAKALSRKELNIQEGKTVLINVGRFVKAKNQENLIRAMENVYSNAVLILIGSGEREQHLKNLVKTLNLNERVLFLGERNDVEKLLKSSDIFILPSLWEGFGLAAVEAMASGLPVVLSEVNGLKEVAEKVKSEVVFFNPNDIPQLARKVNETIINLNEKQSKKSSILLAGDLNIYRIEYMIEKYMENYKKMNARGRK